MNAQAREALRRLLVERRVLSLGLVIDGEPHVGMLPFAATADFGAVLVHASKLARHSKGLVEGAPYSALVHEPDLPEADALALPRVTFQGSVHSIARDAADHDSLRRQYASKLPSSAPLFQLGDFELSRLSLEKGRLVLGLAQALNVSRADFASLAPGATA